MKFILGVVVSISVLPIAGVVFIYSGIYDIAATEPHTPPMRWLLWTTMERSVRAHAEGIQVPSLDVSLVKKGSSHYDRNCVFCHGAPGIRPGEMGEGIRPEAPDLTKHADHWSPQELFWIIKHGIKMTAMPAWGPTHSDQDIWAMVAFLRQLPQMSPEQYRKMRP